MADLSLINPTFTFTLDGKEYKVKKANLEQVQLFQKWFNDLSNENDPALESKTASYCIYLILKDVQEEGVSITQDWVNKNVPGDLNLADIIETFGFMSREKVETLRKILNAPTQIKTEEKETTGKSSTQL